MPSLSRSVVGATVVGLSRFQKFTCEYGNPHTVSLLVCRHYNMGKIIRGFEGCVQHGIT